MRLMYAALLYLVAMPLMAQQQSGCAKDNLGKVVCAPAGGVAVRSMTGVVCAPGQCVTNNLGYLKCSSENGGGASKDNLGNPVCVGQCVSPSKEHCLKMGGK